MFDELTQWYSTWGYMDPQDFTEWTNKYVDAGGEVWTIAEGTLIDTIALFGYGDDFPTVIAVPEATTTWTSTYKVHAWRHSDEPDVVLAILDCCEDGLDDDEYYERVNELVDEMLTTCE